MSDLRKALEANAKAFEKKFGRPPMEGDPVIWDEDEPGKNPVPISRTKYNDQMLVAFVEAGMPDHLIWGYLITGLLPSEDSFKKMSGKEKREWRAATSVRSDFSHLVEEARERLAWNCYPGLTHFSERKGS